ncbi:hypothetical protein FRB94_011284 [Tulasnella sp. JGI-2019a]|nr:hypothetical protein FRB93_004915 [Tulasnella sp. JGI-2019a]KAG8992813.1 hypothetical protein FRB94_011284 [Tulasnella sp. JGI-2019a]KAG9028437.1 hypothetical protein FRB95_006515 [Tulasnella sp. JGI-2019a]
MRNMFSKVHRDTTEICHDHENSVRLDATRTISDLARSIMTNNSFIGKAWSRLVGGGHAQTIASANASPRADKMGEETYHLVVADYGNFSYDLDFFDRPASTPIVVFLHGIGGRAASPYNQGLADQVGLPVAQGGLGCRTVRLTLRGCGDLVLTSPQIHHAGQVNDLGAAVASIRKDFPAAKLYLVGSSLGAGIVMNYLAEMGDASPITAAFCQSQVYKFVESAEGFKGSMVHWIYNWALGRTFTRMFKDNKHVFEDEYARSLSPPTSPGSSRPVSPGPPTDHDDSDSSSLESPSPLHRSVQYDNDAALEDLARIRQVVKENLSLTKFSGKVVAPLAGYESAKAFMLATSSVNAIPRIRVPVLCLNACDDPLMAGKHLPRDEMNASPCVVMAATPGGGHLGFFGKGTDGKTGADGRWSTRLGFEWLSGIHNSNPAPRPAQTIVNWVDNGHVTRDWFHPEGRPEMRYMKVAICFRGVMTSSRAPIAPSQTDSKSVRGLF